jgi:hypothetical protein
MPSSSGSPGGGSVRSHGAWLDWTTAIALCRLDLRPPSVSRVFLAVLLTSARYGKKDARLGVDDLAGMTGLAPRTVKAALATLIDRGLLSRSRRYKSLKVTLVCADMTPGGADTYPLLIPAGGADELAPPCTDRGIPGGADKLAPPRGRQACTSPTSILVSSLEESSTRSFTARQTALIADVFSESTCLLGSDSTLLPLPDDLAVEMGLVPPIGYGEAFEAVERSGDGVKARDYTRAVLALRRDERVQGRELM